LFQFYPRRVRLFGILVILIGLLGLVFLTGLPHIGLARYRLNQPTRLGVMGQDLAWLAVGYVAFESMLISRRQVRNASRFLPRALLVLLGVVGVGFTIAWWVLAGLPPVNATRPLMLMERLSAASFIPAWFIPGLGILAMIFAANRCLLTGTRQVNTFTLTGAMPSFLRRTFKPVPMPLGIFGLPAILALILLFASRVDWLIPQAAGLFLVSMAFVNVSAIYSRQFEPERRRSLVLPFAPLLPVIGIAVDLVLIHALPRLIWLSTAGWLLLGGLYYLFYARHQQVEAKEGEVVFGRRSSHNGKEHPYRILVPIGPKDERHLGLRLAIALAHQMQGEVVPLQVITVPDPLAIDEGRRLSQERNVLFHWSMQLANDAGIPIQPITRLARNVPEGIMDTAVEESCDLVLMTWLIQGENPETRVGQNLSRVARQVPADVGVLVYKSGHQPESTPQPGPNEASDLPFFPSGAVGEPGEIFKPVSILVPTAGGPHAPLAIRLSILLAREYDASITSIYVTTPESTPERIASSKVRIDETVARIREQFRDGSITGDPVEAEHPIAVNGRVISAQSVVAGITQAGNETDLVMLGASEESLIDQVLFGSIPEQVAVDCTSPVIILKHYQGLPRLWLRRTWDALYNSMPTLSQEEQIDVYRSIHRGARPDVDFFVMIGLSTVIAAFGLLQSSSAVIIGAMLVAPFFSPLLAISLSIVQGNVHLLWLAVESTVKGVALSIGLAVLLALLVPTKTITPEIAARSLPSLFRRLCDRA
jgi:nucleotide-binding universal stress UspA family protein